MDLDLTMKNIRSLYQTLSGKSDQDVILTYKGTGYGVTKVYQARVDSREAAHETYSGALTALLDSLKKELDSKVRNTEAEAIRLRTVLNQFGN